MGVALGSNVAVGRGVIVDVGSGVANRSISWEAIQKDITCEDIPADVSKIKKS